MVDKKWQSKGYIDEPIACEADIVKEIRAMAREKNAVIMAHYYTQPEVQEDVPYS